MSKALTPDLCVIGAGSGGLSVAAGAVQMGASVVLAERGEMGGDCLNSGCVPSKALIAAAKHAHAFRNGEAFGVKASEPEVDFAAVQAHVKDVIAGIEPHDSQERFEGLGVTVLRDVARFTSNREATVGDQVIRPRRFVIAAGSSPAAPPIEGLETAGYLTNETLFDLTELPEHLLIIGAGPISMEMAQAFRRLGARVTVIEAFKALGREDPDLAAVVLQRLAAEGVDLRERVEIAKVERADGRPRIVLKNGEAIEGSHLLVAAGRRPNVDALNLEAAGIDYDRSGIKVDAGLRTSNRCAFAIGDIVAGGMQFTHVAGYHAGIVIRRALFRLPAKAATGHIPWCTYTDPEIARVGLSEAEAVERYGDGATTTLQWPFQENDRARAERETEGLIKVVIRKNGAILGAGIAGPQAGELIQPWALALASGLKIKAMAGYVAPYPTLGEIGKRAAGQFYAPKLFSPRTRWIVRMLAKLG